MIDFNITARAEGKDVLLAEIEVQAEGQKKELPDSLREKIEGLLDEVEVPEGGYIQLTTYGFAGRSIVLNLSTHEPS